MFFSIPETMEIYFPGGGKSFFKTGANIEIPVNINENGQIRQMMVQTEMKVERLFIMSLPLLPSYIRVSLSGGESMVFVGSPYSYTTGGFNEKQALAVKTKMDEVMKQKAEAEKKPEQPKPPVVGQL